MLYFSFILNKSSNKELFDELLQLKNKLLSSFYRLSFNFLESFHGLSTKARVLMKWGFLKISDLLKFEMQRP